MPPSDLIRRSRPHKSWTYTVTSADSHLVARDEDGAILCRVPSDVTIRDASDSWGIMSEIESEFPGKIIAMEHDGDTLLVTCES